MEQAILELKEAIKDIQQEIHHVKHEVANEKQQLAGLHKMLERLEVVITKYEGNPEIGYEGKMKVLDSQFEKLSKQVKVLLDAYEVGKVWKIKITGFFMVISFLGAVVGVLFGLVKAAHWIWDSFSITPK
jgi:uncharacterized protein YukE